MRTIRLFYHNCVSGLFAVEEKESEESEKTEEKEEEVLGTVASFPIIPSFPIGRRHPRACSILYGVATATRVASMFRTKLYKLINPIGKKFFRKQSDNDMDDFDMQVVRFKPEGLDSLSESTKFTRKELKLMYRGFKQECPTGLVSESTFKTIYAQFFPQGESSAYAHFVFTTFDDDGNGSLCFEEFVNALSILARGTLQERLRWTFNLYDINGDGMVTKDEMTEIVSAIYDLMGRYTEPRVDENTVQEHVDKVFPRLDVHNKGKFTLEEFLETCLKDDSIARGIAVFDTVM